MYLAHYSWAHVGPGWRYAVGEELYPPVAPPFINTNVIADLQVVDKQPGPVPAVRGDIWECQLLARGEYAV